MEQARHLRRHAVAAILGGGLWIFLDVLGAIHDFWYAPLGVLTYEHYNRLLTLPLVLLVVGWLGIHTHFAKRARKTGRAGSTTVLCGLMLLVAGNVMEFWVILLQARYVPFRAGGPNIWPGAEIGWTVFLLGIMVLLVGLILFGIATLRAKLLPRWNGIPLSVGILGLSAISLGFLGEQVHVNGERASDIFVIVLGIGWMLLGYVLWSSVGAKPVLHGDTIGANI